jgi:hypothetical protein
MKISTITRVVMFLSPTLPHLSNKSAKEAVEAILRHSIARVHRLSIKRRQLGMSMTTYPMKYPIVGEYSGLSAK